MIAEAQKYGARVALYGRKIKMPRINWPLSRCCAGFVDGQISPEEAVRAYHGILQGLGLKPYRSLEDDMKLTHTGDELRRGGRCKCRRSPAGPPRRFRRFADGLGQAGPQDEPPRCFS
jgi:hypothetical protein